MYPVLTIALDVNSFLPGHFPRTVDVVWLHVLGEPVLGHQVELHHGVGEQLGEGPEGSVGGLQVLTHWILS